MKKLLPVRPKSAYKIKGIEEYGLDIDFVECDLSGDLSSVARAMKNADTVVNIAASAIRKGLLKQG